MAKNAKELSQVKARQTKLGKKNAEELIQIILRKDATERKLNSTISELKTEVNSLTSRVNNFNKDQEGNIKAIERWKVEAQKQKEVNECLNVKVNTTSRELNDNKELLNKKTEKIKVYRTLTIILAIILIVEVLINVV